MKRIVLLLSTAVALASASVATADNPPGTGQPSQTCLSTATGPLEPGQAASSPGSPFNEPSATSDGGTAGGVYANPTATSGLASGNTHVVSQYDVACFQVSH
jgi:hypothetical protein